MDTSSWVNDPSYYRSSRFDDPTGGSTDFLKVTPDGIDLSKFYDAAPDIFGEVFCGMAFHRWQHTYWVAIKNTPKPERKTVLMPLGQAAIARYWYLRHLRLLCEDASVLETRAQRLLENWQRLMSYDEQLTEIGRRSVAKQAAIRAGFQRGHAEFESRFVELAEVHAEEAKVIRRDRLPNIERLQADRQELLRLIENERFKAEAARSENEQVRFMIQELQAD